ncbi:hypothetical protein KBD81_00285 [Candidatus Woesebacteria bacterium]|nr:hypothetical protein [Candidatus Woesebacteria bacterium]
MNILYISAHADKKINDMIISALKRIKHTVIDGSFGDTDPKKAQPLANTTRAIKKADAIVVEATTTTFDMGRLMTLAIFQHKPVLILQRKGAGLDIELGANRLVNNKTYSEDKLPDLDRKLEDFMKAVQKQRLTYRFNLMLSRDINGYLMEQSTEKGISKADYIRSLIIQDMTE